MEDVDMIERSFFLPRDNFNPIAKNENYLVDVTGSKIMDEHQKLLGTITDVLIMPKQNIIMVDTGGIKFSFPMWMPM